MPEPGSGRVHQKKARLQARNLGQCVWYNEVVHGMPIPSEDFYGDENFKSGSA
jgi:hypothetical protein